MANRSRTRIGDIFCVKIDGKRVRYFQYVADDLTQLNSQVIRVFKKSFRIAERLDWRQLVNGEVEFYAHVFLKIGSKLRYWEKIANVPEIGKMEVLFRNSEDYGNPNIKISENWHVWKINEPFVKVGRLGGGNRRAEIGVVIAPDSIVHRMKVGDYDFVYPGY